MEIKRIDEVEKLETGEGIMRPLFVGDNLSFYFLEIPPQLEIPPHGHPGEGILYCLEGELEIASKEGKANISEGTALFLSSNEELGLKNSTKNIVKTLLISSSVAGDTKRTEMLEK